MRHTTRHTTTQTKVRPRRRLRRWIIIGLLGALLGALGIFFVSRIYNPFGDHVESPLVLIPDDADFVLSIPDFPSFLGEMRDKPLVDALTEHAGFQRFLRRPFMKKRRLVADLRKAFEAIDKAQSSMPAGLSLLGDVSGRHVLVSGYVPGAEDNRHPLPGGRWQEEGRRRYALHARLPAGLLEGACRGQRVAG